VVGESGPDVGSGRKRGVLMNGFLVILLCGICFIFGFAYSMSYWYERADKNEPITIRGKVYKLVEQDVSPKE